MIVAISPHPNVQEGLSPDAYLILSPEQMYCDNRIFFKTPEEHRKMSKAEREKLANLDFQAIVQEISVEC